MCNKNIQVAKNVSVIIPVYNRPKLLQRALRSIVEQSLVPAEIIVVDDGSDSDIDKSIKYFIQNREQSNTYNKMVLDACDIRYIHISHCGMAGKVRNIGIAASKGQLIAFLDSDDVWESRKIELQVPVMDNYALSHTREKWMREGKEISQKSQKHKREGYIFEDALHKCIIGPSTVMIRCL